MTDITFHFNVADRLGYVCRLLRKAVARGARLIVTGQPDVLDELDKTLWAFSATDFVAHCHLDASAVLRRHSPVLLATTLNDLPNAGAMVINLGEAVVQHSDRFTRLIEVVTQEPAELNQARVRWRQYVALGMTPVAHDAQGRAV